MAKSYSSLLLGLLVGCLALAPYPSRAGTRWVAPHRVQAAISSTATGGNWSAPATWAGGVVPTAADNVTIVAGATVTLDVAATAGSLTVAATGALLTSATTAYSLQVAGSVTNNGTLDLSASPTIGSDLRFTGAGSVTLGGTGTTDLHTLSLAKATRADVVEMTLPTLLVKGSTSTTDGFLSTRTSANTVDDMTGTFKISGTATSSNRVFGNAAPYVIPATGGFWLNNPNFTVTSQNGSPVVNGLLRISGGTFNVGVISGNSLSFGSGAVYTQEGGTLNTTGRFGSFTSATSAVAMTFTLSAGVLNACTVGQASGTPSFGVNGTTTISGGTINLVQRSTATTPLDYYVAGTYNYTGGTVNVGTAATTTNFDFRVRGNFPNLTIDNTTTAKTALLAGQSNPFGTVTINSGASLNLNGAILLQLGSSIVNNGTLTGSATGSRLYFQGSVAQSLSGTGTVTSPLLQITFQNSGPGVTIGQPLTVRNVAMLRGNVTSSNNLTVQSTSTALAVISFGTAGPSSSAGSFDVAPTFDLATSGLYLIYSPELAARTTGVEVPASRQVYYADFNNPQGVALAGGDLTVFGPSTSSSSLSLLSGIVTTSATSKLISGSATTVMPTGSATAYVRGPLGIVVNSATAVSRTFAVGDAAGWRPVVVSGITASTDQTFTATVMSGATGSTSVGLNPTRYVRLENTANLPATARVQLSYGADDVLGNATTAVVAQAASAAGRYYTRGRTAATTPTTGIATALDLTPGFDFFVLADGTAPLPVELVAFTARAAEASVQLHWSTAQEKNNAGFRIERSVDGQSFHAIGYVPGHGSSAQAQRYAFTDSQALAAASTLYYRLRQEDRDGQATYSPVRSVERRDTFAALTLFPNPAHTATQLSGVRPSTPVRVVDTLGRSVVTATADAAGNAVLALPNGLPSGMYLVVAGAETQRLVVE